ncbi:S-adenosyl-L-methionine-dependent methyltransferase [Dichotomocladium elegans]|nr:S-adenosyl-L-methionine-dependent methyltransferase [Dichotomocladium elegans]
MSVFKKKADPSHAHHAHTDDKETPVNESFDTTPVWAKIAKEYDKEIDWDEFVMGIGLMRRWLIGQAKGNVLEVSTGTGRNFGYYKPDQLDSATFTDKNSGMLEEAKTKFKSYESQFKKTFTEFKQLNLDDEGKQEPAGRFDTVIDTFGLCSCHDPEEALIKLAESCKPSEESRILLLEHGRSHYDWLNNILDSNVDKHVRRWGCWWNRDLIGLFERERVKEKLEIVKVYRWHLGTTCYIVAKPKQPQA